MGRVFTHAYAPSTWGSFLRSLAFGHVRQLDAVASRFLTELAGVSPVTAGAEEVAILHPGSGNCTTVEHRVEHPDSEVRRTAPLRDPEPRNGLTPADQDHRVDPGLARRTRTRR